MNSTQRQTGLLFLGALILNCASLASVQIVREKVVTPRGVEENEEESLPLEWAEIDHSESLRAPSFDCLPLRDKNGEWRLMVAKRVQVKNGSIGRLFAEYHFANFVDKSLGELKPKEPRIRFDDVGEMNRTYHIDEDGLVEMGALIFFSNAGRMSGYQAPEEHCGVFNWRLGGTVERMVWMENASLKRHLQSGYSFTDQRVNSTFGGVLGARSIDDKMVLGLATVGGADSKFIPFVFGGKAVGAQEFLADDSLRVEIGLGLDTLGLPYVVGCATHKGRAFTFQFDPKGEMKVIEWSSLDEYRGKGLRLVLSANLDPSVGDWGTYFVVEKASALQWVPDSKLVASDYWINSWKFPRGSDGELAISRISLDTRGIKALGLDDATLGDDQSPSVDSPVLYGDVGSLGLSIDSQGEVGGVYVANRLDIHRYFSFVAFRSSKENSSLEPLARIDFPYSSGAFCDGRTQHFQTSDGEIFMISPCWTPPKGTELFLPDRGAISLAKWDQVGQETQKPVGAVIITKYLEYMPTLISSEW